jgi:hypothetical protein
MDFVGEPINEFKNLTKIILTSGIWQNKYILQDFIFLMWNLRI